MSEQNFKEGDVVSLISGEGPTMVVSCTDTGRSARTLRCYWYDDGEFRSKELPASVLRLATNQSNTYPDVTLRFSTPLGSVGRTLSLCGSVPLSEVRDMFKESGLKDPFFLE